MLDLFNYYREPIFSVALLLIVAAVLGLSNAAASESRRRHFSAMARRLLRSFSPQSELNSLSDALLLELANAQLGAKNYLRAQECFKLLLSRNHNCCASLALTSLQLGLLQQAISYAQLALERGTDKTALKVLRYAAFCLGDLARAHDAARALALLDSAQKPAMKFLQSPTPLRLCAPGLLSLCPRCKLNAQAPFCAHCLEFIEPEIYEKSRANSRGETEEKC